MKDIVIIADSAKDAKKIAQQRYPTNWTFVKKIFPVRYGSKQYIFTVNDSF